MEPYRSYFPHAALLLPETEKLCRRVLVLPNGSSVNDEIIAKICRILAAAIADAPAVRMQLAASAAQPGHSMASASPSP